MAGGMGRRSGPTLGERSGARPEPAAAAEEQQDRRPATTTHCWVRGLPDAPGVWPGLVVEWQRGEAGWEGRTVYAVHGQGRVVLVEAWVPAVHLQPA